MTTLSGGTPAQVTESTTTAGMAQTTVTTSIITPVAATAGSSGTQVQASQGQAGNNPPSAQQIEDLNFYLRRMTLSGNGDISQIESYGGGPDYEMFLDAVSSVGMHYGWTEAQILRTIEMKLKDKAREYYGALLSMERPTTMVEMRNWFRRVFGRKLTMSAGKRELEACIRNPREPLGEYAQRLKVVANKMFPPNLLNSRERLYHRNLLLVNQFIEGLEGRLANEVLRAGEFHNLEDCLEVAEHCEEIVSRMIPETRYDIRMSAIRRIETSQEGTSSERERYQQEPPTRDGARHPEGDLRQEFQLHPGRHSQGSQVGQERRDARRQPSQRVQQYGQGRNRQEYNPRNGSNRHASRGHMGRVNYANRVTRPFAERFPYMRDRCIRCGEEGHLAMDCRKPKRLFCFHCGKIGEVCSLNSSRMTTQGPT